eukprot:615023-Amphidinium_carterae.1
MPCIRIWTTTQSGTQMEPCHLATTQSQNRRMSLGRKRQENTGRKLKIDHALERTSIHRSSLLT